MNSRLYLAIAWLAAAAYAGPPLTTIQDVLYKADGTRFSGVLTIGWNSFQAVDNSSIVTQSITVKVVDGNLRVQLVPSTTATPAGAYSVQYNSDGRVQFQERWAVPSSARALRVREVRVAGSAGSSGGSAGAATAGPINQSDVIGLIADLGARPVKAPTFAAGRVAMVNSAGLIESVSGSTDDCVRVDGSSGPCGSTQTSFIDGDAPAGIVDGANPSFLVTAAPEPVASLAVYRNGLLQKLGADYTFSGRTIQFVEAAIPQPGDTLLASYRLGAADPGVSQVYPVAQVLCSGSGAATASTTLASVGACSIPAGVLLAGDRIEVRYDFEHGGSAAGFSFEVRWGSTLATGRDAAAADVLATGRLDAGLVAGGARLGAQSWGTVLPLSSTVAAAADAYASGLTIDFRGKVVNAADTVTLRNFVVVRLP
jgi:hypothetical protein